MHKVFICYHHKDEYYKNRFEKLFGHIFINKSVMPDEINIDNRENYIKRLILENYITDSSVMVVLIGQETYCRKHVDWEISAALNKKVEGYSGLLGLCLPDRSDYLEEAFHSSTVPPRLVDNVRSRYANIYNWTEDISNIGRWIDEAFQNRISRADRIDNSREQFIKNRNI
jgi:hypothetical protein